MLQIFHRVATNLQDPEQHDRFFFVPIGMEFMGLNSTSTEKFFTKIAGRLEAVTEYERVGELL